MAEVKKAVRSYTIKRYSEAAAAFTEAHRLHSQSPNLLYLACVCLCETRLPENVAKAHKILVKMMEDETIGLDVARTGLVYANFLKRDYKACDNLLNEGKTSSYFSIKIRSMT